MSRPLSFWRLAFKEFRRYVDSASHLSPRLLTPSGRRWFIRAIAADLAKRVERSVPL